MRSDRRASRRWACGRLTVVSSEDEPSLGGHSPIPHLRDVSWPRRPSARPPAGRSPIWEQAHPEAWAAFTPQAGMGSTALGAVWWI